MEKAAGSAAAFGDPIAFVPCCQLTDRAPKLPVCGYAATDRASFAWMRSGTCRALIALG